MNPRSRTTLGSVLLLLLVAHAWRQASRRRIDERNQDTVVPCKRRRRRGTRRVVALGFLAATALVSGLAAFLTLQNAIGEPTPPIVQGGTEYFVSTQDVKGDLRVTVANATSGPAHVLLTLAIDGGKPGRSLDWAFVLTGDGRLNNLSSLAFPGEMGVQVKQSRAGFPSLKGNEGLPAYIVTGRSTTNEFGFALAGVSGDMPQRVVSISGGRHLLVLPSYGIPYLPGTLGDTSHFISLPIGGQWRTPVQSATTIEVGSLPASSRVDFSSPPLDDPGILRWTTATEVAPHATWVEGSEQVLYQRLLFFSGVLAAFAASVIVVLIERFLMPAR